MQDKPQPKYEIDDMLYAVRDGDIIRIKVREISFISAPEEIRIPSYVYFLDTRDFLAYDVYLGVKKDREEYGGRKEEKVVYKDYESGDEDENRQKELDEYLKNKHEEDEDEDDDNDEDKYFLEKELFKSTDELLEYYKYIADGLGYEEYED